LIVISAILLAFFISIGLNAGVIALVSLSLVTIAYAAYVFSDRLTIALMRGSSHDVPAPVSSAMEQYCDREHIPVPLIAIVHHDLPDVYIDGINNRKKILMITSGAVGQLSESELCDVAIKELAYNNRPKVLDTAALKLITAPLSQMYAVSLKHRHMQNGVKLAGRLNEHIIVRRVEEKDFLRIYRMGVDAFRGSTEFIPLHKLAYRYRKPTTIDMIVEYDGQPAGFIIGHIKQGKGGIYGHIDIVAVDAQYRGKGIGIWLVDFFMRALEEYGCLQCCLEVWQHNDTAIRLYEKAGFAKRALFEDYYSKGQHAEIMCKKLAKR
jgi:ribosomal protein S18 acetylase RimI-like enzyme